MTEFKINIDQERQLIKLDINKLERKLLQLNESLEMLQDMKRKVEASMKLQKLLISKKDDSNNNDDLS